MGPRVFLSFRYADKAYRNDLLAFFALADATPVFLDEDIGDRGEPAIKAEILKQLATCRGLIVVVGDSAHNSPWLDYEIQTARTRGLPCIVMRHPQSRGGLPNAHRNLELVDWKPAILRGIITTW